MFQTRDCTVFFGERRKMARNQAIGNWISQWVRQRTLPQKIEGKIRPVRAIYAR